MPRGKHDHLFTSENAKKFGSKGGKRSVESKRRKKSLAAQMKAIVDVPIPDRKIAERLEADGFSATYGGMVLHGIVRKACSNAMMAGLLFKIIGEDPEINLKQKEFQLRAKMMEQEENAAKGEGVQIIDDTGKTE